MWKLDLDEDFFRIYDSKKQIAGYFDPDYGNLFPEEKQFEIIEQMHKTHEKITGGFLTVPLVKFGIFTSENEMNIDYLEKQLDTVNKRLMVWKNFILESHSQIHSIRVSHTDQDMLSITFPIKFNRATPLEKKSLLCEIEPILDPMHKLGLL